MATYSKVMKPGDARLVVIYFDVFMSERFLFYHQDSGFVKFDTRGVWLFDDRTL